MVLTMALALALRKHAQAWLKNHFKEEQRPRTGKELLAFLAGLAAPTAPTVEVQPSL